MMGRVVGALLHVAVGVSASVGSADMHTPAPEKLCLSQSYLSPADEVLMRRCCHWAEGRAESATDGQSL